MSLKNLILGEYFRFNAHGLSLDSGRSANAIESIESLVLSFLTQLSLSLEAPDLSDDVDGVAPSRQRRKTSKIELRLADRKKAAIDGYIASYPLLVVPL
jgi:hypothetical protein